MRILLISILLMLSLLGCSDSNNTSKNDISKYYTIKTNYPADLKKKRMSQLKDLYDDIQTHKHGYQIAIIELERKDSNFKLDLQKMILESRSLGLDYKSEQKTMLESYRKNRETDVLMIRIENNLINEKLSQYKKLLDEYNQMYPENSTNPLVNIKNYSE